MVVGGRVRLRVGDTEFVVRVVLFCNFIELLLLFPTYYVFLRSYYINTKESVQTSPVQSN